jgi:hypothetical protein
MLTNYASPLGEQRYDVGGPIVDIGQLRDNALQPLPTSD